MLQELIDLAPVMLVLLAAPALERACQHLVALTYRPRH